MQLGELIQRIQSLYSKGVQSDSSRLTPRHIYNKFLTVRSKLLSDKAKKKQRISEWNYQVLPCVEMIDTDVLECPCISIKGCTVKRSKNPIPKIMTDYNNNLIDYVMTADNGDRFDMSNRIEMLYSKYNRYTGNKRRYVFENGHIYIYGEMLPSIIKMRALFEDPLAAKSYEGFCGNQNNDAGKCLDFFQTEFPIDGELVDVMIQFTVDELISMFSQNPEDITNDNMDTVRVQPK